MSALIPSYVLGPDVPPGATAMASGSPIALMCNNTTLMCNNTTIKCNATTYIP